MKYLLFVFLFFTIACGVSTQQCVVPPEKCPESNLAVKYAAEIGKSNDPAVVAALTKIVEEYDAEDVDAAVYKAVHLARDEHRRATVDEIRKYCEYYKRYAIK